MSKPASGHFKDTTGYKNALKIVVSNMSASDIIKERTKALDIREHPVKNYSSSSIKKIKSKVDKRTATKNEYKKLYQSHRLAKRRANGVKNFWKQEKYRIKHNLPTTRAWTQSQIDAICANKRPKFKDGSSIQGHHTYSVSLYPHLANLGEVIYPVTINEHRNGWHGKNYKKSLPGKPIINIKDF